MPAPAIEFALFVTPIEGQIVTRYGAGSYIGVTRQDKPRGKTLTMVDKHGATRERFVASPWGNDSTLAWDTETIVPIPRVEFEKYRKEYTRAIAPGGGLKTHTREQWDAQRKERKAKAQEAAAKAEADAKRAAPQTTEA